MSTHVSMCYSGQREGVSLKQKVLENEKFWTIQNQVMLK